MIKSTVILSSNIYIINIQILPDTTEILQTTWQACQPSWNHIPGISRTINKPHLPVKGFDVLIHCTVQTCTIWPIFTSRLRQLCWGDWEIDGDCAIYPARKPGSWPYPYSIQCLVQLSQKVWDKFYR